MGSSGSLTVFGVAFLCTAPVLGHAQEVDTESRPLLSIPKINREIELDGMPDEAAWQEIEPIPMIMYLPESGDKPTEHSDIRIAYTENYLYVGARLYDSEPDKIQSTALDRDSGSPTDDWLGIVIDSFNDNENALAFFITPGGARTDLTIYNDAQGEFPINISWDTFWTAPVVRNGKGWFTEMRIPFSSLRYQSNGGDVAMGLIVHRWIARKAESSIYPAIPNEWGWWGQWKPSQSRQIRFQELENKRPLYIAPYLLGGFSQHHELNEEETARPRDDDLTYDAGLDLKYGLTSNLTLDLTINTDFAQVEADNQQVNLTRFSLFFPEKRKFFQERSSLFDVNFGGPNRLFYSRRIGINDEEEVRILGGARLVGRIGGWDVGLIEMQTAKESADIPAENFGVLRLRRRVFNRFSYIGTMFTSRVGSDGSYNYAYGLDGLIRVFDDDYLTAALAQTLENGNSNRVFSLDATRALLEWETRRLEGFGYSLSFSRSGPDYNPGVGFELREDYTRFGDALRYGWFAGDDSPFISHQISLEGSIFFRNSDWSTESAEFGPKWEAEWENSSYITAGPVFYYENLDEPFDLFDTVTIPSGSYRYLGFEGIYNTPSSALLSTTISLRAGRFYDGYRFSNSYQVNWSLSSKFKLSPYYELNRISFPERNEDFTAHVGRVRLQYFFSNKLSVSTFAQYSNASEAMISNFRLRYNPREGNDLYIVYNEALNTDRFGHTPVQPLSNSRTFLVKYTYTFRY